jgi:hypothetical protein
MNLNESIVEDAPRRGSGNWAYAVGYGAQIVPGEPAAERDSFDAVVLVGRLHTTIARLNLSIPVETRGESLHKVLRVATTSLVQTNRVFHRILDCQPGDRRLAYAGQREEFLDALLRRLRRAAPGDAEPNHRGPDRPERLGRATFRPIPSVL